MNLKTGDKIVVISGKDKGKEGLIKKVLRAENKVIVEGVNVRKIHLKPKNNGGNGEIIEKEAPIHRSNVKLEVAKSNKKEEKKATKKEVKKEVKKTTKKNEK